MGGRTAPAAHQLSGEGWSRSRDEGDRFGRGSFEVGVEGSSATDIRPIAAHARLVSEARRHVATAPAAA